MPFSSGSARLSYLHGASQACPTAALLSVYHNGTSVRNQLGSTGPRCRLPPPAECSGLLTSCESAHAASWWCPCLCRAALCRIMREWGVMRARVGRRLTFQWVRQVHDFRLRPRQRHSGREWADHRLALPPHSAPALRLFSWSWHHAPHWPPLSSKEVGSD